MAIGDMPRALQAVSGLMYNEDKVRAHALMCAYAFLWVHGCHVHMAGLHELLHAAAAKAAPSYPVFWKGQAASEGEKPGTAWPEQVVAEGAIPPPQSPVSLTLQPCGSGFADKLRTETGQVSKPSIASRPRARARVRIRRRARAPRSPSHT